MKKCTGKNCPMRVGFDFENCSATEKCPFHTWPITISDRIRNMTDKELAGILLKFRNDEALNRFAGVSDLPETLEEIEKWLENPWEGKP